MAAVRELFPLSQISASFERASQVLGDSSVLFWFVLCSPMGAPEDFAAFNRTEFCLVSSVSTALVASCFTA